MSHTDTKSYKEVVRLISEGVRDPAELAKVIHGRTGNRAGKDVIQASLTGVISETDIDIIRQLREEVELAEKHKDECQSKMDAICQQYFPKQLENLQTISKTQGCYFNKFSYHQVVVRRKNKMKVQVAVTQIG